MAATLQELTGGRYILGIGAGWNTPTDNTQCIREEGSVSRPEFVAFLTSPLTIPPAGFEPWAGAPAAVRRERGTSPSPGPGPCA